MSARVCLLPDGEASGDDDAARAETQKIIESAMRMLRIRHHIGEAPAYAILVQASIDDQVSVRTAAVRSLANPARSDAAGAALPTQPS